MQWRAFPFILVFPGYFVYGWSGLNEWTPMMLGGYVNEVSALICLGFVFVWVLQLFLGRRLGRNLKNIDIFFFIFMAWFSSVIAVNFALATAPGVTKNHFAAWIQMVACYLATRNLSVVEAKKPLLFLTLLCSFFVFWAAQSDLIALLFANKDLNSAATYQGLARSLLISSVFAMLGFQSRLVRWLYYFLIIVALFFLGARTEIAGAAIVFSAFEILVSRRPLIVMMILLVIAVIFVVVIFGSMDALVEVFPDNRLLNLMLEGNDDGSVVERAQLKQIGWSAVADNPILGSYGHYEQAASPGAYVHNWLGAWVDLGLGGLLLYVALHVVIGVHSFRFYQKARVRDVQSEKRSAALGVSLFLMITIFDVVAKNFSDTGLATITGCIAALSVSHIFGKNQIFCYKNSSHK